jgi:hypothetical protein
LERQLYTLFVVARRTVGKGIQWVKYYSYFSRLTLQKKTL